MDTLPATLPESGAKESVERKARADLAVLSAVAKLSAMVVEAKGRYRNGGSQCHSSLHNYHGSMRRVGHDEYGPRP